MREIVAEIEARIANQSGVTLSLDDSKTLLAGIRELESPKVDPLVDSALVDGELGPVFGPVPVEVE